MSFKISTSNRLRQQQNTYVIVPPPDKKENENEGNKSKESKSEIKAVPSFTTSFVSGFNVKPTKGSTSDYY